MDNYDWRWPIRSCLKRHGCGCTVLVTDVAYPIEAVAQLYRDRCDCENGVDELKNQWGLSGFTTQDINRSQTTARAGALVYKLVELVLQSYTPGRTARSCDEWPTAAGCGGQGRQPCRPNAAVFDAMPKQKPSRRWLPISVRPCSMSKLLRSSYQRWTAGPRLCAISASALPPRFPQRPHQPPSRLRGNCRI